MQGSGIVYTLTKRDADAVAVFLNAHGIAAEPYSGERATEERIAVEERLLAQRPQGGRRDERAGDGLRQARPRVRRPLPGARARSSPTTSRSGAPAAASTTPTSCCCAAPRTSASRTSSSSRRSRGASTSTTRARHARRAGDGLTTREISAGVNLGLGAAGGDAQGARRRGRGDAQGHQVAARPRRGWAYEADRYRGGDRAAPRRAGARWRRSAPTGAASCARCRRSSTTRDPQDCGRCSVCAGPRFAAEPDPALVRAAQAHLRSQPLTFEPKRMAPDGEGAMRKIPEDAARRGRPRAGARRRRGLVARDRGRARGAGAWATRWSRRRPSSSATWGVPRRSGSPRCRRAARGRGRRRRRRGRAPASPRRWGCRSTTCSRAPQDRPPQTEMRNAAQQVGNVRGAFARRRRGAARAVPARRRPAPVGLDASRWSAGSCARGAPGPSTRSC